MKNKILIFISIMVLITAPFIFTSCKSKSGHENHQTAVDKKLYHCPMHPTYTSNKPGDCPICGMNLVPIESDKENAMQKDHNIQQRDSSSVPGYAEIKISPEREQLIGVKTGEVSYRNLKKIIRASARVAYDTELYNAISEYKASVSAKENIKESPWPDVHERADALIRASTLRLRQIGLSDNQIQNINSDYKDPTNLLLGGKGGSIWVYAQVYEYEAGLVNPGQKMEVIAPALPGKKFYGTVKAVDPILNSESRSLKIRAEVSNPDGLLKPEMYVNAKIFIDLGTKLAVPEESVLDTGERQIIFVVMNDGKYVPRNVRLGQEAEGYYEVISGVSKGEKVVTSANFLIDSESRLKAAISGAGNHQH